MLVFLSTKHFRLPVVVSLMSICNQVWLIICNTETQMKAQNAWGFPWLWIWPITTKSVCYPQFHLERLEPSRDGDPAVWIFQPEERLLVWFHTRLATHIKHQCQHPKTQIKSPYRSYVLRWCTQTEELLEQTVCPAGLNASHRHVHGSFLSRWHQSETSRLWKENLLKGTGTLLSSWRRPLQKYQVTGLWELSARINTDGGKVCVIMCLLSPLNIYSACVRGAVAWRSNTCSDINEKWHCKAIKHFGSYLFTRIRRSNFNKLDMLGLWWK